MTFHDKFDVSDVTPPFGVATHDTVDAILDVAGSVLADYGPDDGTRIARMAKWLAYNVGGEPYAIPSAGQVALVKLGDGLAVGRVGDMISAGVGRPLSTAGARALAVALLRVAEIVERAPDPE